MIYPLSNNILIDLIESKLNANPKFIKISPILGGKFNQSYQVKINNQLFILRIAPPDDVQKLFYEPKLMHQEASLHNLIQNKTTIPVPEIIVEDFSRTLLNRDFLIMRARPGVPLSQMKGLTHRQHNFVLTQLGQFLSQLHQITKNQYGYLSPYTPMEKCVTWQDAFEIMWCNIINAVVSCGMYSEGEAEGLINLKQAYQQYFTHNPLASLLRANMSSENILVDKEGNVTGLLAFNQVLWGDKELDFAVLDHCGIYASAFWEGYGAMRPTDETSQIRRRFYLMYEIQKQIPLCVWRNQNLDEAQTYKQTAIAIATGLASKL